MSIPPGAWFRQVKAANFPRGPVSVAEAFYKYARLQRGIHNVGPGLPTLMRMSGYGRRAVLYHVRTLVDHGWLYQTEEGHHGQIARYALIVGIPYKQASWTAERVQRRVQEGCNDCTPRRESLVVPSQRELPTRPEEHQETAEQEAAPRRAAVSEIKIQTPEEAFADMRQAFGRWMEGHPGRWPAEWIIRKMVEGRAEDDVRAMQAATRYLERTRTDPSVTTTARSA